MDASPSELMRWWRLLGEAAAARGAIRRCHPLPSEIAAAEDVHPVVTVVACLTGAARIESAGRRLDLAAGDLALIAPGTPHRHAPLRRGCAVAEQGFDDGGADLMLKDSTTTWRVQLPAEPLVTRLAHAEASDAMVTAADVIATWLDLPWRDARPLSPAQQRMIAALRRLALRRGDAAAILDASGLGRSQAHAAFRAATGTTPARALAQRRCLIARGMLRAGLPVATVARRCGFADRSTFQRTYRRHLGLTPRDER